MKKTWSVRKETSRKFDKRTAQEWVKNRNLYYKKVGSTNRAEYRYLISEYRYGVYIRRKR